MFKCLFKVERWHLKKWIFNMFNFSTFQFSTTPLTDINSKFKIERLNSWKLEVEMLKSGKVESWNKLKFCKVENWKNEMLKSWNFHFSTKHRTLTIETWKFEKARVFHHFKCSIVRSKSKSETRKNWLFNMFNFPTSHTPPLQI